MGRAAGTGRHHGRKGLEGVKRMREHRRGGVAWIIIRYFIVLGILTAALLLIDPNYFQAGIGEGMLGLEPAQAPATPFASELTFAATAGDPFRIDVGAKQRELRDVRIEVLNPDNAPVTDQTVHLLRPPDPAAPPTWQTIYAPATRNGTYTLRLTQQEPGQVKVYLFQGPHLIRIAFLPLLAAILLGISGLFRYPASSSPA